jgi:hypothetical protein
MAFEVYLVLDLVLPGPLLPDSVLPFSDPRGRRGRLVASGREPLSVNAPLIAGVVRIAPRERPDEVQVVGEDDHRDGPEWIFCPDFPHHVPKQT